MVGCREAREGRCDVVFTQTGGNAGDRVDVGRYEDAGVGYIGESTRLDSVRVSTCFVRMYGIRRVNQRKDVWWVDSVFERTR